MTDAIDWSRTLRELQVQNERLERRIKAAHALTDEARSEAELARQRVQQLEADARSLRDTLRACANDRALLEAAGNQLRAQAHELRGMRARVDTLQRRGTQLHNRALYWRRRANAYRLAALRLCRATASAWSVRCRCW